MNTGECIKKAGTCGSGCTYTLDDKGNLNINGNTAGTGSINSTFRYNRDIVNVNIGQGIATIGSLAFAENTSIQSVTIAEGVKSILAQAFLKTTNIKSLTIPSTTAGFGNWAFSGMTSLEEFELKNKNLTGFDVSLLSGNTKLKELILPESITSIGGTSYIFPAWEPKYAFDTFIVPENVSNVNAIANNSRYKIYCTGAQIENGVCTGAVGHYERNEDGKLIIYNSDNSIKGIYSDYTGMTRDKVVDLYEKTDPETGVVTKYNGRGVWLSSTWQDAAGSVYNFDENGNLKGITKRGPFTIPEADAATQGKGPLRLDITW